MRVLQLIDSLETGGAERVAINIANGLSTRIDGSFLCATRKEGQLKSSVSSDVKFLFLNKQRTIDFMAIKTLSQFVKKNKIDVIHAHSTSFFLATIIRLLNRKLILVWHDHYGNSDYLKERSSKLLVLCSQYFSQVFSVNKKLEQWGKENLWTSKVNYLPNFAVKNTEKSVTELKGRKGKRVVCLANLRPQKDHFSLIDAFSDVVKLHPEWTLHCVGKDFNDQYSKAINNKIENLNLKKNVFVYGSKPDISNVLEQSDIGVLSSKSEGLPIALLEYGLAGLPSIVTNVGDCKSVITDAAKGQLVEAQNSSALKEALIYGIENKETFKLSGRELNKHVISRFSEHQVIKKLIKTYIGLKTK